MWLARFWDALSSAGREVATLGEGGGEGGLRGGGEDRTRLFDAVDDDEATLSNDRLEDDGLPRGGLDWGSRGGGEVFGPGDGVCDEEGLPLG